MNKKYFSLNELIIVMAISLILVTCIIQTMDSCFTFSKKTDQENTVFQQLPLIAKQWRKNVNSLENSAWKMEDNKLSSSDTDITFSAEKQAVIIEGKTVKKIYLPKGVTANLKLENADDSPTLVLNLSWNSFNNGHKKNLSQRVVACPSNQGEKI